jgi:hypothetical protein
VNGFLEMGIVSDIAIKVILLPPLPGTIQLFVDIFG